MSATLIGNRLQDVRVIGRNLTAEMAESCISASLSLSTNQVTEMSLSFADNMAGDMWRNGIFTSGTNIDYGGWRLVVDDVNFGPGALGPMITVKAPSRYVAAIKRDTGAFTWGLCDVSDWMVMVARHFGMTPLVQPGLGVRDIIREGPTGEGPPPSTWDVMAEVARTAGAWLFEVRDILVCAKPEWLRANATRKVNLYYNSWFDYSDGLSGPPQYHGSGAGESETLQLGLISPDADGVVPGDILAMTGASAGNMGGTWIVESVAFPMTVAGPVTVACKRVGSNPSGNTSILGIGETNWGSGNFTVPNFSTTDGINWPVFYVPGSIDRVFSDIMAALLGHQETQAQVGGAVGVASVDAFVRKYTGVPLDYDGAFGAQCVDLTAFYFKEVVGVTPARGNGKDIFFNQSAGVTRISGAVQAKAGDVACWGSSMGGGYGHVAVVLADQGGSMMCFSQNPGPCRQMVITKAGLIGLLRPNRVL